MLLGSYSLEQQFGWKKGTVSGNALGAGVHLSESHSRTFVNLAVLLGILKKEIKISGIQSVLPKADDYQLSADKRKKSVSHWPDMKTASQWIRATVCMSSLHVVDIPAIQPSFNTRFLAPVFLWTQRSSDSILNKKDRETHWTPLGGKTNKRHKRFKPSLTDIRVCPGLSSADTMV